MTVRTLIEQLQKRAELDDEVTLIVEGDGVHCQGIFTGTVIGSGTGAEKGKCEVYGLA